MKRLTKSQYELIAQILRYRLTIEVSAVAERTVMDVADELAVAFAQTDNQFDKERFIALCGIQD